MKLFNIKNQEVSLIQISAALCLISVVSFVVFLFQVNRSFYANKLDDVFTINQLHSVINRERLSRGIKPLELNDQLVEAAQAKAEHMKANQYFSHISPTDGLEWRDFIIETGYEYKEAGENLANGYEYVEEVVDAWLKSPSHRVNMLNSNVDETGFGIKYGFLDGYPTVYVVQVFGAQSEQPENSIELVN